MERLTGYGRKWRESRDRLQAILSERQTEFKLGAMHGERVKVDDYVAYSPGRLAGSSLDKWLRDRQLELIDYVVWSYGTPIAWHRYENGWCVPEDKYSPTTTRHQSYLNLALNVDVKWSA